MGPTVSYTPVIRSRAQSRSHPARSRTNYPPREVQGFYTKDELRLLIQRRASRLTIATLPINEQIAGRGYQSHAIRRVAETFENDAQRDALLVMATGSGKTRTVIALTDLMMRANWAKRILFRADRKALVRQAVGAFKAHLLGTPVVNLVEEKDLSSRVFVFTYPTLMNIINKEIASALLDQLTIPAVRAQQELLGEIAGDEW